MKRLVVLAVSLALCACASTRSKDDDLGLIPPPQPNAAQSAVTDARVAELQVSLTELLERLDVLNDRIARLEAANSELRSSAVAVVPPPAPAALPTPAAPAPRVVATASVPEMPASSALLGAQIADNYRSALMLYGKGRIAESRKAFQDVFDSEPNGDLADNALYWIGETWFAAGNYAEAMRYYGRVIKEYGETNKAPDALYKMGIAYEKTGDLGLARKTFEECVSRYPYSTAAASAKLEMKRIKY